jgi:hypothetical protein
MQGKSSTVLVAPYRLWIKLAEAPTTEVKPSRRNALQEKKENVTSLFSSLLNVWQLSRKGRHQG